MYQAAARVLSARTGGSCMTAFQFERIIIKAVAFVYMHCVHQPISQIASPAATALLRRYLPYPLVFATMSAQRLPFHCHLHTRDTSGFIVLRLSL